MLVPGKQGPIGRGACAGVAHSWQGARSQQGLEQVRLPAWHGWGASGGGWRGPEGVTVVREAAWPRTSSLPF